MFWIPWLEENAVRFDYFDPTSWECAQKWSIINVEGGGKFDQKYSHPSAFTELWMQPSAVIYSPITIWLLLLLFYWTAHTSFANVFTAVNKFWRLQFQLANLVFHFACTIYPFNFSPALPYCCCCLFFCSFSCLQLMYIIWYILNFCTLFYFILSTFA